MVLESGRVEKARSLSCTIQDLFAYAYFSFLRYTLEMSNVYNAIFQKRKTMIQELQPKSLNFLIWILQKFLKDAMTKVESSMKIIRDVDFESPANQKSLEDIDFGEEAHAFLDQLMIDREVSAEARQEFFENRLQSYISASSEIRNHFSSDDVFSSCTATLRLQFNFRVERAKTFPRFLKLCIDLLDPGSFDSVALRRKWDSLLEIDPDRKAEWSALFFDEMWSVISTSSNAREGTFPNLLSLVTRVRTFPHSNTKAERVFSMLTDAKTAKKNRLRSKAVNSICVMRSALKTSNETTRTMHKSMIQIELMNP